MARTCAIVIGGSLAGLCAARVLADFFDKVTVIERDTYPDGVADRAGVPQGRHNHSILIRALREYEKLFPEFEARALARGAKYTDGSWDFARLAPQGWLPRVRSGYRTIWASRALIETTTRELCCKLPNIDVIQNCPATGLVAQRIDGRLRCIGVQSPSRGGAGVIDGDLIVDASGASSKACDWIRELGLEPPRETVVDALAGYASRWFKPVPPDQWPKAWWWNTIAILRCPGHLYEAIFGEKENGRWLLTVAGFNRNYPPTKEDEFMGLLPQLRSRAIAEMVRLMEPDSPVYANRAMRNRWRHYEGWSESLDGYIAVGDGACVFNPVYAQGISVAAVAASTLRTCLEKENHRQPGFAPRFFAAQARFNRDPWRISTGLDIRFPFTQGDRPLSLRLFNRYMDAVNLAASDPVVGERLDQVINLLRPASSLFEPSILRRVIAAKIKAAFGLRPAQSEIPPFPPSASDAA
jgi:2-polyprenyl-6-methoxyphenol hydroxylase-like FAD-dependent oxidoreductase